MPTGMPDAVSVLAAHIDDPATGWSVDTFGAIGEFMRDLDEPVALERSARSLSAVTDRGAIRLDAVTGLRLFASEGATKESWSQRVALCLPDERCRMNGRTVMTELGPDVDAMRERDRNSILFDLGLGARQVDVCIRVADPAIAGELRALCGRAVFDHGNPAMRIILAANPHRVFLSRIGRVEVFQPIPPPDGKSPEGPHTHVLPKLLRNGLTHPATEPIPTGWVPCAHFYPAHPAKDAMGMPRAYDATRHAAFQELIRAYGNPELIDLKARMMQAVSSGEDPSGFPLPKHRFARATIRVGLRQLKATGTTGSLAAWQASHDKQADDDGDLEDSGAHGPS